MADDSENVNRAVRLLQEAADVLSQTNTTTPNTRPTNDHTSTSTVLTSANCPAASSSRSSGSCSSNFNNASNDTTNEALRNFRLLFSPYGSILIIKINAQHSALSKAIKTRFKIEIIYCDVSS